MNDIKVEIVIPIAKIQEAAMAALLPSPYDRSDISLRSIAVEALKASRPTIVEVAKAAIAEMVRSPSFAKAIADGVRDGAVEEAKKAGRRATRSASEGKQEGIGT